MINVLIGLILAAVIATAALRVRKRAKSGGGCCGDRPETLRKTPVKDHNRAHYPYEAELQIGGYSGTIPQQEVEELRNAIKRLPERQQKILEMTYWLEMKSNEIAEVLGIAPSSVRVALKQARDSLREMLGEE